MSPTLTTAEFHVLLVLRAGPRHGYGIMQDVQDMTDGTVRLGPGTLYTAIKRLLRAKRIEECQSDGSRRRCYRLSRLGHVAAAEETRRLSALLKLAGQRGLVSTR